MNQFDAGEAVHCYLTSCASSSGGIVDPTPLKFAYWPPTTESATIGTTNTLVTTGASSGQFYCEVVPASSQTGLWHYHWYSTGSYRLSQWGAFRVIEPPRST